MKLEPFWRFLRIRRTAMEYAAHLTGVIRFVSHHSGISLVRESQSTSTIIPIKAVAIMINWWGLAFKLKANIPPRYWQACSRESALKKTQARVTSAKVSDIWQISLKLGNVRP